jgi:NDP-sugar pyrophosphorylase family protein
MDLAIISAGESSRMFSEGISIPKPLIKINGEPMIKRIIDIGVRSGVNSVKCIVNSRFPELEKYLLKTDFGVPLDLIVKSTSSSMHSLFELSRFLNNDSFCLATSDTVFLEREFKDFINFANQKSDSDGTLAITGFIDDEKPLCVKLDGNRIIGFQDNDKGLKYATGGLYYFSPSIFEMMDEALNKKTERLRNFLRLLIENDFVLNAYEFSKMIDVDHVVDIKTAEEFLKNEK